MAISKQQFPTIDEYIMSFPEDVQRILKEIRQTIAKTAPLAAETISYQMPTFKIDGKYLVYFAGWKNHVSLYPVPSNTTFQDELAPYLSGKGTAKFPLNEPIPYDLVKKVVLALMKAHPGKKMEE